MITVSDSLILARKTVALILKNSKHLKHEWYVESYQNGREQGLLITDFTMCYYISRHRNTEDICIYKGDYSMQSISENAYRNSKSFKDSQTAADWVVTELKEHETCI